MGQAMVRMSTPLAAQLFLSLSVSLSLKHTHTFSLSPAPSPPMQEGVRQVFISLSGSLFLRLSLKHTHTFSLSNAEACSGGQDASGAGNGEDVNPACGARQAHRGPAPLCFFITTLKPRVGNSGLPTFVFKTNRLSQVPTLHSRPGTPNHSTQVKTDLNLGFNLI